MIPWRNERHMRLIHTSDWHFGKRFNEFDMLPLQAVFCDWFVDLVKQEEIDCVLLAGDVYDRANPKDDAVDLLDDVLHRISSSGASIVMISGNHDSADRLHFGTRFMSSGGLHVRTERREIDAIAAPVTVRGRKGDEVEILPLPYLDPERVITAPQLTRSHESVLKTVIDRQVARLKDPARTIAMAHAFVTGGAPSDSERNLTVGGTGSVSLDLFRDFGYVALGHLHKPQVMGDGRAIYSGTPMPYSFSEQHGKFVRLISVDKGGISSTTVASDACRQVATIEGTLNELTSSKFANHKTSFVRARITDQNFQIGAMERLRESFPYILELEQQSLSTQGKLEIERLQQLAKRSEEDVVNEYVKETWPHGMDEFESNFVRSGIRQGLKVSAE